jgi:hypothetical protein
VGIDRLKLRNKERKNKMDCMVEHFAATNFSRKDKNIKWTWKIKNGAGGKQK